MPNNTKIIISVVCPIYNEELYISECIDTIIAQDYPRDCFEILFVDGMSTDRTREIIHKYSVKYPFIRLFDNYQRIVPVALNIGVVNSRGTVIIRLDAHAKYPSNYFSTLVRKLDELGADNVGGVCRTLPINDTPVCRAIATALSSSFGMGNSYFRIGASDEMQVDTVPFGCFRRSIFDKIGLFDEELIRNQDDEFNARIIKNGGKIFLLPSLVIDYFARDKISKVSKMFYQYGLFKPLVNKKLGRPATLRQFFPMIFIAGLLLGAVLACFSNWFMWLYISGVLLYFCLSLIFSIKGAKSILDIPILIWTFFSIHLSYGYGYWIGIFKVVTGSSFSAEINR